MRLHDKSRGIGTGFTGRWASWQKGLETFWKSPLIGHGFRAHLESKEELGSHSGYIRLLIETGLIGTGLAVMTVVIEALRRLKLAKRLRDAYASTMPGIDLEQSFRLNAVACAAMLTVLTYWVYEPMYLNLGTVMSLIFFLMFAAPDFVPCRQTPFPVYDRALESRSNWIRAQ
jgi:O-antigen ligase